MLAAITLLCGCPTPTPGTDPAPGPHTVVLGSQVGSPTEGQGGSASYSITTENIADGALGAVSWFTSAQASAGSPTPLGVTCSVSAVASNKAVFDVSATTAVKSGSYYFKVTIDNAESSVATLVVQPAPAQSATIGTQIGKIVSGSSGSAAFAVSTANVPQGTNGIVSWWNSSYTASAGAPSGISVQVSPIDASNAATITIAAGTSAVAGVYYFRLAEANASAEGKLAIASPGWSAWFDSSYVYKKKITINHLQIPNAAQSSFPVLITEANLDSSFFAHVRKTMPDSLDVIFTDETESAALSSEVVRFDPQGSSSILGSFQAWVKLPSLSNSVDTVIYMYYGNDQANNPNAKTTWSAGYQGVWHLDDTAGPVADSSPNGIAGTMRGALPDSQPARIGNGQGFNGSTSYIDLGAPTNLNITGSMTVEAWVRFSSFPASRYQDFISKGDQQYRLSKNSSDNRLLFSVYDGSTWVNSYSDSNLALGSWYYVVGRFNAATGEVVLFVNGVKQQPSGGSATSISGTSSALYFGQNSQYSGRFFNGIMDEVRIASQARTDSWIAACYNNQSSPQTFYSVGSELVY